MAQTYPTINTDMDHGFVVETLGKAITERIAKDLRARVKAAIEADIDVIVDAVVKDLVAKVKAVRSDQYGDPTITYQIAINGVVKEKS